MLIIWAVLGGFVLDAIFADPAWLPHPVVLMGRCISALEKRLRAALPTTPRGELLGRGYRGCCAAAEHSAGHRRSLLAGGQTAPGAGAGPAKCSGAGRPLRPKALSRKA